MVVWSTTTEPELPGGIYARKYSGDGSPETGELELSDLVAPIGQSYPAVAALNEGGFVVTWHMGDLEAIERDVVVRRFQADGTPSGPSTQVNVFEMGWQYYPSVETFSDDGVIVVWGSTPYADANPEQPAQDGSSTGVFAQRFNPDGTKKYK